MCKSAPSASADSQHIGHEGSHAICESFQYFVPNVRTLKQPVPLSGVIFILPWQVECAEVFDASKNDGLVNIEAFRRLDGVALLRLRTQDLKAFAPSDKFVIIVRTDLLRWSLSNYYKQSFSRNHTENYLNDSVYLLNMDPQFKHLSTPLPVHDISLDIMVRHVPLSRHALNTPSLIHSNTTCNA